LSRFIAKPGKARRGSVSEGRRSQDRRLFLLCRLALRFPHKNTKGNAMTVRTVLTAAAFTIAATAALAQPAAPGAPNGALIVPAKDLATRLDAPPARPGAAVSSPITTTGSFITMVAHRTADGMPEQHAHWIDVMVMLQGDITLTYGGTLSGNTVDANGESHGGTITGGTTVVLHKGDYLQVPAGLPHLMTQPKGDFRYFVTKIHA
jgi:hypothetical protein